MIFIVGVPRSGKSTLAKLLKQTYTDANIISCDALKKSLMSIELSQGALSCLVTNEAFLRYAAKMASWNEALTGQRSIVDAGSYLIEDIYKVVQEDDKIICLGFGGQSSAMDIWNNIQTYQKDYDYTCNMDFDRAHRTWGDFGIRDKNNRYFCVDNNLLYMDTATNQKDTLKFIVELLKDDFNTK